MHAALLLPAFGRLAVDAVFGARFLLSPLPREEQARPGEAPRVHAHAPVPVDGEDARGVPRVSGTMLGRCLASVRCALLVIAAFSAGAAVATWIILR